MTMPTFVGVVSLENGSNFIEIIEIKDIIC
jgi:hypothetical protein